jgi:hypothetical protein
MAVPQKVAGNKEFSNVSVTIIGGGISGRRWRGLLLVSTLG